LKPKRLLKTINKPETSVRLQILRTHLVRRRFQTTPEILDCHLLVFLEAGMMIAESGDRQWQMQAGDLLWLQPGDAKRFRHPTGEPTVKQWNLRFHLARRGSVVRVSLPEPHWRGVWDVHPTLEQIRDLYEHGHPYADLRFRALLSVLLSTAFALPTISDRQASLTAAQRMQLDRFVADHLHQGIRASDLAVAVGLSADYFSRLFRATYDLTPRKWLVRERMRRAATLLEQTTLSAKEVAGELGIASASLFTRQFRQVHGCTPSDHRLRA
jgi:AraC-like DNA-binding protein